MKEITPFLVFQRGMRGPLAVVGVTYRKDPEEGILLWGYKKEGVFTSFSLSPEGELSWAMNAQYRPAYEQAVHIFSQNSRSAFIAGCLHSGNHPLRSRKKEVEMVSDPRSLAALHEEWVKALSY